jgi:hypothetical protein
MRQTIQNVKIAKPNTFKSGSRRPKSTVPKRSEGFLAESAGTIFSLEKIQCRHLLTGIGERKIEVS